MVHKKGARSGVLLFTGKRQGPSSGTISVTFRTELLAITSFAVDLSCRENHLSALICNWQKTCLYHKGKKALTTRLFPSTQLVKRNFLVLSGAEKRARKRVFFSCRAWTASCLFLLDPGLSWSFYERGWRRVCKSVYPPVFLKNCLWRLFTPKVWKMSTSFPGCLMLSPPGALQVFYLFLEKKCN